MRRRTFVAGVAGQALATGASPARAGAPARAAASEPQAGADLALDLTRVPLSRAGSYLTLGAEAGEGDLPLRLATVRKTAVSLRSQTGSWSHDLASFGLIANGAAIQSRVEATGDGATLTGAGASARVRFADADALSVEALEGGVRILLPRSFSWRRAGPGAGETTGFDFASGHVVGVVGATAAPAPRQEGREAFDVRGGGDGAARLTFTALVEDAGVRQAVDAGPLDAWMARAPRFAADDTEDRRRATRMAWFLFWNLQVAPSGGYGRTAILSSKRSLSQVWSWDNLFNAMAVAPVSPELAWAQLQLVLDHQLADGLLPDTVSDLRATYGFNKPPLWGWTIRRLLPHTPADRREALLGDVYPKVARLHAWWLAHRDLRGDGAPCYLCGLDSGWDNSTVFDGGGPVQSPDLLALLTLDAEALADVASALGLATEAERWRTLAADHLARLHQVFVDGDALLCFAQIDGRWEPRRSTSLLTRIPLLLGRGLAAPVRARIVRELGDPAMFCAPCGPASEALSSPAYTPKGYWRGPVWGPSTLLVVEGLLAAGEPALARRLAERYRATCARDATFRENYDARTGEGYDDSGMTWSAADYLLLGAVSDAHRAA